MAKIARILLAAATVSIVAMGATAPASARDWDWAGGRQGDREYRLVGPGVSLLAPELRNTNRGRAFVLRNFDDNHDTRISLREARAANSAFAGIAGPRRGAFDWAAHDRGGPELIGHDRNPGAGRTDWDHGAMRDYRFRQTSRGATMTMQDEVLFQTDSATLRPGAIDRLRPMADYFRANSGVRVAITGYTDARGTDQHNQDLSERRAASVRAAFEDMGVGRARFQVEGRGENDPVASNTTAEGQRLNRRVEVTLLGERADRFSRAD